MRRIGATAWSADGRYATIEFSKPSRWLDSVPSYDISLLDVKTRSLRQLSPRSTAYMGFFNAVWSRDGKRLAFLSIDHNAIVRVWVWTVGTPAPSLLPNVEARTGSGDPALAWIDGDRLAIMSWEPKAQRSGGLYWRVLRGRNVATAWERAFEGKVPSVSVLDSGAVPESNSPSVELLSVLGQSDGGFAVLGLITQTNRFRSAIASAGFSNFTSLYGTLYGQFRHGDAGRPEVAQVLRMLQLEKGAMSLGGPPWKEADRYRENSPIHRAPKVETPLLLIHGELDFVPIQQSEEFFTALFRQDKRVRLLRYAGEGHTISDRVNVLDLWKRLETWLSETMAPRRAGL